MADSDTENDPYLSPAEMRPDNGPDLYLRIADSLARAGKIREAVESFSAAYCTGPVNPDRLRGFVNTLVDVSARKDSVYGSKVRMSPGEDVSNCAACLCILFEPVTLPCGHTYCRPCLTNSCNRCGFNYAHVSLSNLKMNVLVANLLQTWWPKESEAARLKSEGNDLLQKRRVEEAVAKYAQAFQLAPNDHLLLGNQSQALLQLGKLEEALTFAEGAVKLRPDWPKVVDTGYYQKAVTLQNLGKYEDAFISYMQCLVLDNEASCVKNEVTKLLHKIFLTHAARISFSRQQRYSRLSQKSCRQASEDDSEHSSGDELTSMQSKRKKQCIRSSGSMFQSDWNLLERPPQFLSSSDSVLKNLINRCLQETEKTKMCEAKQSEVRTVDPSLIDRSDFECTLCYRLFWEPITSPCGHIFCRTCLNRCLDHNPVCPLCKTSLKHYLAERKQSVTEFIEIMMERLLPEDYHERKRIHQEEMEELSRAGLDSEHEIPIFVCTVAYPTVPCPLHVFEPRYRHMIRQCMESGSRQFGMCTFLEEAERGFAEFGTVLRIREVQYFPDGRSVVDTIGVRRFRILQKNMRDGYNTASVEFLKDEEVEQEQLEELKLLHDVVHEKSVNWFENLNGRVRQRILCFLGSMPSVEMEWITLPNGPAWLWWMVAILPLEKRAQLDILSMTSLKKRLEALQRTLNHIRSCEFDYDFA